MLATVAHEHGFEAHHVVHRGWESRSDAYLRAQLLEGEFTLVTNNWRDFQPMLEQAGLHAGAIILPTFLVKIRSAFSTSPFAPRSNSPIRRIS